MQFVRRLAAAGCLVAIPTLISRSDELSGSPHVAYTNQPHREFIYRQAFEMGRHVIGYEVQKVLAAVDLIEQHVAAAAQADVVAASRFRSVSPESAKGHCWRCTRRRSIRASSPALVCGYFQEREEVWQEPIYRNVWGLLTEFGDAELAGLIAPRRLVIEACRAVEVAGPPRRPGRVAGRVRLRAGSRTTGSPRCGRSSSGPRRSTGHWARSQELVLAVSGEEGHGAAGTDEALAAFAAGLGIDQGLDAEPEAWQMAAARERWAAGRSPRPRRLARNGSSTNCRFTSRVCSAGVPRFAMRNGTLNPASADEWERARKPLRDWVHDELIGRLPSASGVRQTRVRDWSSKRTSTSVTKSCWTSWTT